jgi:hypothetical protein
LVRRQFQFVSEAQAEDLVFRVGCLGRFQPLLDCGRSRHKRVFLFRSSAGNSPIVSLKKSSENGRLEPASVTSTA